MTLSLIDLGRRRSGIGGTDISAILGMNPWRTAWDVWLEKYEGTEPVEESSAMHWGSKLEATIADEFASRHPELGPMDTNAGIIRHPEVEYMFGSPDALFRDAAEGLEIKTCRFNRNDEWGESGSLQIPQHYYLQCAWYMAVLGWQKWHVAVLIGGQDYREYTFERNIKIEIKLIEAAMRFWENHVMTGNPPPVDASPSIRSWIASKYPSHTDEMVVADGKMDRVFQELLKVRAEIKRLETAENELRNKLCMKIGPAAGMTFSDGSSVTWKRSKDRQKTDWKAVAEAVKAPESVIEAHTEVKEGSRRFLVKPAKQ